MNTKHAIIADNYFHWLDGEQACWQSCTIIDARHAWLVAQAQGITHFWVWPGCSQEQAGMDFLEAPIEFRRFVSYTSDGLPKFASVRFRDFIGHTVYIGYPQRGRWNWTLENPVDILQTVQYLESKIGVPVEWSPGHMGGDLLNQAWEHLPLVLQDCSFDLRDLPFVDAARGINFRRALTSDMIGQHVHHDDKNSEFLSACRSVKCGIGDPVHLEGGEITPGLPGIYRVDLWKCDDTFDGVLLPRIIEVDQEWVTNDVLEFAIQQGCELTIREAWVFEDYKKILNAPAWSIWSARKEFKDEIFYDNQAARQNAYNTCKEIALIFVGNFAMNKQLHPGIDRIHPNWWADVVGRARVALLANIKRFAAVAGAPICVERDGLFFVSRDPNWRTAVPGILDRQGELGGFKHEGSCQLTQNMFQAAKDMSAGQLAAMLKAFEGMEANEAALAAYMGARNGQA